MLCLLFYFAIEAWTNKIGDPIRDWHFLVRFIIIIVSLFEAFWSSSWSAWTRSWASWKYFSSSLARDSRVWSSRLYKSLFACCRWTITNQLQNYRQNKATVDTDELSYDEDGVESEDEESEIERTIATMILCLRIWMNIVVLGKSRSDKYISTVVVQATWDRKYHDMKRHPRINTGFGIGWEKWGEGGITNEGRSLKY